jgi:hypothetical protein
VKPAWESSSARSYLKKPFTNIGLVEWLKGKTLSSSLSASKKKKAGGVAQTVQPLSRKHEALSSNSSTKKKKILL